MPPPTETRSELWRARYSCIDFIRSRIEECGFEATLGLVFRDRPWIAHNVRHLFNKHRHNRNRKQLGAATGEGAGEGVVDDIGLAQFARIVVRPCFYCGVVYAGGIDRLDSVHGYASDNVVASCSACNLFKGALHVGHFVCAMRVLVRFWTLGVPSDGTYTFASRTSRQRTFVQWGKVVAGESDLAEAEWDGLMRGACDYCGLANAGGIDRVDPRGRYVIGNCASCCHVCNYLKGARPVHVFRDFVHLLHARFSAHGGGSGSWQGFTGATKVLQCSWHIEKGRVAVRI